MKLYSKGRFGVYYKKLELSVSSSVSSKCDTTGFLKQLIALRLLSRAIGSSAVFEPLQIPSP